MQCSTGINKTTVASRGRRRHVGKDNCSFSFSCRGSGNSSGQAVAVEVDAAVAVEGSGPTQQNRNHKMKTPTHETNWFVDRDSKSETNLKAFT